MNKHKFKLTTILGIVCIALVFNNIHNNQILAQDETEDELTYKGDPFFLDEESNVIPQSDNDLEIDEYTGEDFNVADYKKHNQKTDGAFQPFMMFRSMSISDTYGVVEEDNVGTKDVLDTFDTYEEANNYYESEPVSQRAMIYRNNRVVKVQNGVVNFRTKNGTTNYTEDATGRVGYTYGAYGADAAYLETSPDGKKIKFMLSGVIGWVDADQVQLLNYDGDEVNSVNYYVSKDGAFYHNYTTDIKKNYYHATMVGPAQSYLNQNQAYYSYDGHYFYSSYAAMINDYRAGHFNNAVNAGNPYYNYYQYLSHRSISPFSATDIDRYIASKVNSDSKLTGSGESFVSNQNKHGTNASLMLGVAINESAWGTSYIAKTKNNLFGHAAYDSDPNNATGYKNVGESIEYHSKVFLSIGYFDPLDYGGRYFGAHLGDKASGVNVKYASDPYWGEKAAAQSYALEKFVYGLYQTPAAKIGVIEEPGSTVNIRKEATTSSAVLYQNKPKGMSSGVGNYPFVILDTVTGESVGGNNQWYKIQADPTLNDARTAVTQDVGVYNFNRDYAYVHSSSVKVVVNGDGTPTKPDEFMLGDVNGDGKVNSVDYIIIKNYIMGKRDLSDSEKVRADVNADGKINSQDYMRIKKMIMER